MNTYKITLLNQPVLSYKDYGDSEQFMKENDIWREYEMIAETPGKAKYCLYIRNIFMDYNLNFGEFLKHIWQCKCLHKFKPSDLFVRHPIQLDMFERMKVARGIEFAYIGMKIQACGKQGVIVGSNSGMNPSVCFEGNTWTDNVHPWDGVEYYDNRNNLIKKIS